STGWKPRSEKHLSKNKNGGISRYFATHNRWFRYQEESKTHCRFQRRQLLRISIIKRSTEKTLVCLLKNAAWLLPPSLYQKKMRRRKASSHFSLNNCFVVCAIFF